MARLSSNPVVSPTKPAPPVEPARQLVGKLDSDGTFRLEEDLTCTMTGALEPPRSLRAALKAAAGTRRRSSDASSETASEEDYDALKHDPMAVVRGGKGGGFESPGESGESRASMKPYDEVEGKAPVRPGASRLRSVPVTLNKLKERGRYILTADDDALREVLRMSIERGQKPVYEKRRSKFSDLVFTRRFTVFDRQNTESAGSPFHGFFTLFWLGTAIYMLQIAADNWTKHGNILGTNEIMGLMFRRDLLVLAISDGVMCAATGFGLLFQRLILQREEISWNKRGWIIQSAWESFYILAVLYWTLFRAWPWTHTVFFVLHGLVMLMKQHSYAFYNGHLSEEYKLRRILQRKLKQLDSVALAQNSSTTSPRSVTFSASYLDKQLTISDLTQRRQYQKSPTADEGSPSIAQVAELIESEKPLNMEQIHLFERVVKSEIDALTADLKGKCTAGANIYPTNLTFRNHYEYIVLPTLVYELEYPRASNISWSYVAEKTVAVFGILGIMNMVSQTFIYPVVVETIRMKEEEWTLQARLAKFPSILNKLIFPFMMEYMMTWYVIWECILNLLAELTYFSDRGFYADWWNSVSWDQFARDWNRPVHNFLLRHVYHSSISTMKVNKYTATLITFFLSACVHELVMWCLFKKLRGYLLFLQMMQLPLVRLSRSRWLRGHETCGNLIFWIGIFTGPSLLCSLYLII